MVERGEQQNTSSANSKTKSNRTTFKQHDFKCAKTTLYSFTPEILITPLAWKKMFLYVDIADKEVGWYGAVTRVGDTFIIQDCYMPKQKVSSVTTVIDGENFADLAEELVQQGKADVIEKLRFWGHSHVTMGTTPSGQDNEQMDVFRKKSIDWFIRGILNKKARMEFTMYMYDMGIKVTDVPWQLKYNLDVSKLREEIQTEFDEKVKNAPYFTAASYYIRDPKTGAWEESCYD